MFHSGWAISVVMCRDKNVVRSSHGSFILQAFHNFVVVVVVFFSFFVLL